jgi:hypothetical protein
VEVTRRTEHNGKTLLSDALKKYASSGLKANSLAKNLTQGHLRPGLDTVLKAASFQKPAI